MLRNDIINRIILQRFPIDCDYLEIGVCDPERCYNKIFANRKTSVDPGYEFKENPVDYRMTSDDFFSSLNKGETEFPKDFKWDVVFIDGMHLAEFSTRDIMNSIEHTKDNGVILLHDCSPPIWSWAHSDYNYYINNPDQGWNGTVWKSIYYARTSLDYSIFTVDTDYGVGVIDKKNPGFKIKHDNFFFEYGKMAVNRRLHLGLISIDDFLKKDLS